MDVCRCWGKAIGDGNVSVSEYGCTQRYGQWFSGMDVVNVYHGKHYKYLNKRVQRSAAMDNAKHTILGSFGVQYILLVFSPCCPYSY